MLLSEIKTLYRPGIPVGTTNHALYKPEDMPMETYHDLRDVLYAILEYCYTCWGQEVLMITGGGTRMLPIPQGGDEMTLDAL